MKDVFYAARKGSWFQVIRRLSSGVEVVELDFLTSDSAANGIAIQMNLGHRQERLA